MCVKKRPYVSPGFNGIEPQKATCLLLDTCLSISRALDTCQGIFLSISRSGDSVCVTVTRKPCNPRDNGQEVPCSFSAKSHQRESKMAEQYIFCERSSERIEGG